jgi:hypothetical protein
MAAATALWLVQMLLEMQSWCEAPQAVQPVVVRTRPLNFLRSIIETMRARAEFNTLCYPRSASVWPETVKQRGLTILRHAVSLPLCLSNSALRRPKAESLAQA